MTFSDAINEALAESDARVRAIDFDGRRYWLKRRERLGLRMRIQKGDASRAFDAERAAFDALSGRGLPVAEVVSSGEDWLVTEDGGLSVRDIFRRNGSGHQENAAIFEAAGRALAALHAEGVAHGRPAIKDILWDGTRITFIDFERFRPDNRSRWRLALDVIIFAHSIIAEVQEAPRELDLAVEAYRSAGGEAVWTGAKRYCRKMSWLKLLLAPIKYRRADRGRDVRAVALTLDYFTRA